MTSVSYSLELSGSRDPHRRRRRLSRAVGAISFTVAVSFLVGCGSKNVVPNDSTTSSTIVSSTPITTKPPRGEVTTASITPERCAANRDAGPIVFMSPYDYAASAGILEVVTAKEQGYFDKMCLDVSILPSDTGAIPAALAANRAQFASVGSMSEVAAANAADAGLLAIAQFGHTSIEELVVLDDSSIKTLADLKGKTIGTKGAGIPYSVQTMMAKAGVSQNDVKTVSVGYTLSELQGKQTDAEPVYKSNEPNRLAGAGVAFRAFDPSDSAVKASFGVLITSSEFGNAYPEATEDFVRATLKGHAYAVSNATAAIQEALTHSKADFFFTQASEEFRWAIESALVASSTPKGMPQGIIIPADVQSELDQLVELGVFDKLQPAARGIDERLVPRVTTDSGDVIWPQN